MTDRLRDAVEEMMRHQLTGTRPAMQALTDLVEAGDAAADEIERLRAALRELVRIYVYDGAAVEPVQKIGEAWDAAQEALKP